MGRGGMGERRRKRRKRRWWKMPADIERELRRLLHETELPATECRAIVGLSSGSARGVIKECRRYIGQGQWIDVKTGKVKPAICTAQCASKKTGLSVRTLGRRIATGIINDDRAVSHLTVRVFSEADIERLNEYGKHPGDNKGVLTREDVRLIREAAALGISHTEIATYYPVSCRQISRVVSGERWAKV